MGAPYSSRLFLGTLAAAVLTPLYTVPAGELAIVQHIDAANTVNSADVLLFQVVSGSVTVVIIGLSAAGSEPSQQWSGKLVLLPGDVLKAESVSHVWNLQVSGAVLSET